MGLIVDQVNQLTRGGWDLIREKRRRGSLHKRRDKTRGARGPTRQEEQQEVRQDGDGSPCFQLEEDINN